MNKILENILNPAWWFGTVIVAFLINLVSDYSKPAIDKWLSKYSHLKRETNEKKKRQFDEHLSKLISEPVEVVVVEVQYTRNLMQIGFSLATAITAGFFQAVATELRLAPYLDFMSDATIFIQMLLKNTIFYSFVSIVLLFSYFFSAVVLISSNKQLAYLRDLLSEYRRRKKTK